MNRYTYFIFFVCVFSANLCAQSVMLQMPINNSQNVPSVPLFTWNLFPTPGSNVRQIFTLAPYNSSQSNQTTLDNNAVFSYEITSSISFQSYLYGGPTLSNCTDYIWQVKRYSIGSNNQEPPEPVYDYQSSSDIFVFRTQGCSEEEESSAPADVSLFIVPYKYLDHFVYVIHGNTLNIKYEERYNNTEIHYGIYTSKNEILLQDGILVNQGVNYLSIELPESTVEESPVIYTIELHGAKGDVLKAKFEKKTL